MRIECIECIAIILGISTWLCGAIPAEAQVSGNYGQRSGMFGGRTFGQPLTPRDSQFGSRMQRGPSGNFQGLSPSGGITATPWRQPVPSWPTSIQPLLTVGPGTSLTLGPGSAVEGVGAAPMPFDIAAEGAAAAAPQAQPAAPSPPPPPGQPVPGEVPSELQSAPATWFRSTGAETDVSGATSAAEPRPTAASIGPPKFVFAGYAGTAANRAGPTAPPLLSQPHSAHLTRVAQFGGVRTATGISVYLGDGTAILRGTVATPRDRDLAANLALLEPGIWRIDNQLSVASVQPAAKPGATPAASPSRSTTGP